MPGKGFKQRKMILNVTKPKIKMQKYMYRGKEIISHQFNGSVREFNRLIRQGVIKPIEENETGN